MMEEKEEYTAEQKMRKLFQRAGKYRERKEIAVEGNVKWFTIHWDRPSKETHTVKRSQYNPCSHTVLQQ